MASSVTEATHSGRSPATSLAAATTERRLLRSTGINLRHLLPLLLLLLPATRDAAAGSLRSSAAVGRSPRAPRRCDNESKSLESGRESEILKTSCLEKETLEKKHRCPVDPLSSLSLLSLFSLSSLSLLSLSHLRRCLSLQTLSSLSLLPLFTNPLLSLPLPATGHRPPGPLVSSSSVERFPKKKLKNSKKTQTQKLKKTQKLVKNS